MHVTPNIGERSSKCVVLTSLALLTLLAVRRLFSPYRDVHAQGIRTVDCPYSIHIIVFRDKSSLENRDN